LSGVGGIGVSEVVTQALPERAAVLALAANLARRDGAPPLSDQALTRLGSADVRHLWLPGRGYAQLDGDSLEIAALDDALEPLLKAAESSTPRRFLVWTHGRHSRLAGVLGEHGYEPTRILHRLLLPSLDALPADPQLPADIVVRAFVPGQDEDAWLRVNSAAFVHHPEQGSWGRAEIVAREAEDWFDPAGFFLAERDGELLGFHWTKTHPDGRGEVYVLGVSPDAQGLGLGAGLLVRGLRHLADRGCPAVLLYVDDDNGSAMRLYARYGFVVDDTDVQWTRPAPA
jgi:mycothiol synthase